jgi:PAS domain S-box-containing protein
MRRAIIIGLATVGPMLAGCSTAPAGSSNPLGTGSLGLDVLALLLAIAAGAAGAIYILGRQEHSRTRELRSANEQFRLLVEGVSDYAIFMLNPTGKIASWNAGAERIKGYVIDEIIGQPYSVFFTTEDRQKGVPEHILDEARRKGRFEGQGVRVRKNGARFHADVVMNALHNANGELIGFAKITRDVTERVEAQASLEQLQDQLAQSQKMEALGQLTGGMAHDFNNMLAVITSAFQLSGRALDRGEADKAREFMASGIDGAKRAAELIRRLLAFARKQPLAPKPLDANALVQDMSEILRRTLGEHVQLETVLAGGLWPLNADQNQLESALINLATNARDAMAQGGKLTIETSNAHLDDRYAAEHVDVPPGQYVLIAVSDTGTGMTPDQIAKAFEPFFTTKGTSGSGLGLAQVYGFAKQSGGHARIYSEAGHGTTVKLYLQRASMPAERPQPKSSEAAPLGTARQTILVVEDEMRVRQLTAAGLRELGYTVIEADGAESALKVIDSHPEIALLFTDVVMPEMDGRKLATEVLKRRPNLKVLFTTGFTKNAIIHGGVLDPDTNFIAKPFTLEDLARKVREVLNGD